MVTCKPSILSSPLNPIPSPPLRSLPLPSDPLPSPPQDLLIACEEEDTDKFSDIVSTQEFEGGGIRVDGRGGVGSRRLSEDLSP